MGKSNVETEAQGSRLECQSHFLWRLGLTPHFYFVYFRFCFCFVSFRFVSFFVCCCFVLFCFFLFCCCSCSCFLLFCFVLFCLVFFLLLLFFCFVFVLLCFVLFCFGFVLVLFCFFILQSAQGCPNSSLLLLLSLLCVRYASLTNECVLPSQHVNTYVTKVLLLPLVPKEGS